MRVLIGTTLMLGSRGDGGFSIPDRFRRSILRDRVCARRAGRRALRPPGGHRGERSTLPRVVRAAPEPTTEAPQRAAVPRGVVGFEVDRRCPLAAADRGDTASIAGWFEWR